MSEKKEKILDDVRKSGFPSELKASSVFRNRKWNVEGNTYFIDQDEQKGREIDLFARHVRLLTNRKPEVYAVSLVYAEVKKSDKPWVIFSSEKTKIEESLTGPLVYTHNLQGSRLHDLFRRKHPSCHYPRYGRSGYIGFSQDSSTFFGAVISAAKACIAGHQAAEEQEGIYSDVSLDAFFYSPLIILDGGLYECYLDCDGDLVLDQVKLMPYSFHYASPRYEPTSYHVDIVTLAALYDYVVGHEI